MKKMVGDRLSHGRYTATVYLVGRTPSNTKPKNMTYTVELARENYVIERETDIIKEAVAHQRARYLIGRAKGGAYDKTTLKGEPKQDRRWK